MTALPWPDLLAKLKSVGLEVTSSKPDSTGWVWARCVHPENHSHGDKKPSLHINEKNGAVKCMTHGCITGNLNDLAKAMGVSAFDDEDSASTKTPAPGRTPKTRIPTYEELEKARKVPAEVWKFRKWVPTQGGYLIEIDDPDAKGHTRKKALPGLEPKYSWTKGAPAKDLVYGLSRINPAVTALPIAEGEPDQVVLDHAGYPAISFLAGAGTPPSAMAIQKVKDALPALESVQIIFDRDTAGASGALRLADQFLTAEIAVDICTLPDTVPVGGDITDLWVACNGDRDSFTQALDAVIADAKHMEPLKPKVHELDYNEYKVSLPSMGGWIEFGFSGLDRRGRDLSAEVSAHIIEIPGLPKDSLTPSNLNLASLSGRDSLKKELETMFGQTLEWPQQINRAVGLVREAYYASSPAVDLFDVVEKPITYRIGSETEGFIGDGVANVLFGDGGVSKTNIGLSALISVAYGVPWHGMDVVQCPCLILDAEAEEGIIKNRITRQLQAMGSPGTVSFSTTGRPEVAR